MPENNEIKSDTTVVNTQNAANGQNKCPKCGSTDISLDSLKGQLRCNFCRYEFALEKPTGLENDISKLSGTTIASGTQDIKTDNNMVTFKCSSCGAEIVIDTSEALQARCHWCRNTLSVNEQIPNGAVPDVVLPFSVTKESAEAEISNFVKKRQFFANPQFKKEFTTVNIMGVYLPYMVVDVNSHANLSGEGEHLVRTYTRGSNENKETYYDADLYHVEREFDMTIEGLTVESSKDKLNNMASDKTNNVINAIMPFDIENCVIWNPNYLKGYTSEKRDTNVSDLSNLVETQAKDIVRYKANETLTDYDRGVSWKSEDTKIIGEQWKSAYLPVWLYSYQEVKSSKKVIHYVAVNARTKETMGSVPIHMPKLILISLLIELAAFILMLNVDFDYNFIFLLSGFVYFFMMLKRYRNANARHTYEKDTKTNMTNLRKVDNFIEHEKGLRNARIAGENNYVLKGQNISSKVFDNITNNPVTKLFNNEKK